MTYKRGTSYSTVSLIWFTVFLFQEAMMSCRFFSCTWKTTLVRLNRLTYCTHCTRLVRNWTIKLPCFPNHHYFHKIIIRIYLLVPVPSGSERRKRKRWYLSTVLDSYSMKSSYGTTIDDTTRHDFMREREREREGEINKIKNEWWSCRRRQVLLIICRQRSTTTSTTIPSSSSSATIKATSTSTFANHI